jgi:pimeloyl-ACP methyl ester carboxylesterase
MAPRLVLVHGIGGPRQPDAVRNEWIAALANGARDAGHSRAAEGLEDGSLADVVFAYYGHLFQRAQEQGAGRYDLDENEAVLLNDLLTEMARALCDAGDEPDPRTGATLARVIAQLEPSGEAEGAGNLVRRAINAATTLLGAGAWGRAGGWASGRLLVRDLAQVARYLARGEPDQDASSIDARIREVITGALGPGPALVVAHSLGSVVAFETLHDHACSVPLWVTLGSPLAMRAVVWPKVRPRPPATPETVGRWLNFWDRDDVIAARPILESDVLANAAGVLPRSVRVDSSGLWVHTATKYLAKADVAGPVMEALGHLASSA